MRVCYTGGGTLGHVLPALAVHSILKSQPGYECLFIGSRKQSDRNAVEKVHVPYAAIYSGKLRRYFSFKNFLSCFGVLSGFFQSIVILLRFKPDVLFSKGGYVSVPPVLAAHLLHIPVVIHESDATAGLANRISGRFADKICVPFEEAGATFPKGKVVVTGNPVRPELLEPSGVNLKSSMHVSLPLVLVMGGSQGAMQVNNLVWDNLDRLAENAFVWHQCGKRGWKVVRHENYRQCQFIGEELPSLYEACDLVVSRSGAGILSEICHYGKPSILVPLSGNSRGDQMVNARRMEEAGASLVWSEGMDLPQMVEKLLADPARMKTMGSCAASLEKGNAAQRVADVVAMVGGER